MLTAARPGILPALSAARLRPRSGWGGEEVSRIDSPAGPLQVYLARPAGAGPWPGVVLVPGPRSGARHRRAEQHQARELAARGFLALVPDPVPQDPAPPSRAGVRRRWLTRATAAARRRVPDGLRFDGAEAARSWLAGHPECTGGVSVVGRR